MSEEWRDGDEEDEMGDGRAGREGEEEESNQQSCDGCLLMCDTRDRPTCCMRAHVPSSDLLSIPNQWRPI